MIRLCSSGGMDCQHGDIVLLQVVLDGSAVTAGCGCMIGGTVLIVILHVFAVIKALGQLMMAIICLMILMMSDGWPMKVRRLKTRSGGRNTFPLLLAHLAGATST
jgi:hypothetical protein